MTLPLSRYGPAVVERMKAYDGQRILDVGSGASTGVPACAGERNEAIQVDCRSDAVARLTGDAVPDAYDATPMVARGEQLPFTDGAMDVLFGGAVFGSRLYATIRAEQAEVCRVLAKDGDIVVASCAIKPGTDPATRYLDALLPAFSSVTVDEGMIALEAYNGEEPVKQTTFSRTTVDDFEEMIGDGSRLESYDLTGEAEPVPGTELEEYVVSRTDELRRQGATTIKDQPVPRTVIPDQLARMQENVLEGEVRRYLDIPLRDADDNIIGDHTFAATDECYHSGLGNTV